MIEATANQQSTLTIENQLTRFREQLNQPFELALPFNCLLD